MTEESCRELARKHPFLIPAIVHEMFLARPGEYLDLRAFSKDSALREYEELGAIVIAYRRYAGGMDVVYTVPEKPNIFIAVKHSMDLRALEGGARMKVEAHIPTAMMAVANEHDTAWHPFTLKRRDGMGSLAHKIVLGELEYWLSRLRRHVEHLQESIRYGTITPEEAEESVAKHVWSVRILAKLLREARRPLPDLPPELRYVNRPVPKLQRLAEIFS